MTVRRTDRATPRRSRAQPARQAPAPVPPPATGLGAWWMLAYAAVLAWGVATDRLPWAVPAAVCGLSVLTFLVYGADKQAARAGRRRTPENTLHLLALAGGWPGAWCAQRLLRHKSRKASFLAAYRATVLLHVAGVLAWLVTAGGALPWR